MCYICGRTPCPTSCPNYDHGGDWRPRWNVRRNGSLVGVWYADSADDAVSWVSSYYGIPREELTAESFAGE